MVFQCINVCQVPRPSASVFNSSLGTWQTLMHEKPCLIPILISDNSRVRKSYFLSIFVRSGLVYIITLRGHWGTTDDFTTIPFHQVLSSAALAELAKSTSVHSFTLSSHLFFCRPFLLSPFCRIVFAKPEDLDKWPNQFSSVP